jgi:adenosylcobinamide-phosphate synthase
MVTLEPTGWSLPLGAALDALLGDPRGWPHPVRLIGRVIVRAEAGLRWLIARAGGGERAERWAGVVLALVVVGLTTAAAWGIAVLGDRMGPLWGLVVRTLLIYWGLGARSLGAEALRASEAVDLATARRELALIVGRDTASLDRGAIGRACIETVAENCNDAVVAPLFWLALGGPAALWAFKAVNTLDSMVGYRNERYRNFGWASARLDDLLGFVPARLTWLLIASAALVRGERPWSALRIGWRDGRKHPSPNAAWGEAAMAAALGVQLGGPATYGGVLSVKPLLGDPGAAIETATVRRAVGLMRTAALLAVLLAWGLQLWVESAAYSWTSHARAKPAPMAAARVPSTVIRATRGFRSASAARGWNQRGYSGALFTRARTPVSTGRPGIGAATAAATGGSTGFGAGFRGAASPEGAARDRGRKSA